MDELDLVRDLYGEPPLDPWLKERVRRRLDSRRRRRRRFAWSAGALATATAAAVIAVLPGGAPDGRDILLAAATSAASSPPSRGPYWHVEREIGGKVSTLWVSTDGRAWRDAVPVAVPFSTAGRALTFEEIQRLPTDEAALERWVTGVLPPGARDEVKADAVAGLLWSKPSPPKVRAAAYRVLADLPSVRYLGPRTDPRGRTGDAFAYGDRTLIIDPDSSQVLSATDGRVTEVVVEAGFTDRGPR
ncbi:hypothetical protein [Nonomuraea sediminis]|uniref:hypothetical protein n=1 Tax=Nonomuraea sediminis TaxID=2835864 RepID=UPI001BDBC1D5|nr:hypothetical protein [Nonomuraea sediminis]